MALYEGLLRSAQLQQLAALDLFQCPVCNKVLQTEALLASHNEACHPTVEQAAIDLSQQSSSQSSPDVLDLRTEKVTVSSQSGTSQGHVSPIQNCSSDDETSSPDREAEIVKVHGKFSYGDGGQEYRSYEIKDTCKLRLSNEDIATKITYLSQKDGRPRPGMPPLVHGSSVKMLQALKFKPVPVSGTQYFNVSNEKPKMGAKKRKTIDVAKMRVQPVLPEKVSPVQTVTLVSEPVNEVSAVDKVNVKTEPGIGVENSTSLHAEGGLTIVESSTNVNVENSEQISKQMNVGVPVKKAARERLRGLTQCRYCDKVFEKFRIMMHIRNAHKFEYVCFNCQDHTPTLEELKEHMEKNHANEKSPDKYLSCQYCGAKIKNCSGGRGHLVRHIRQVHKIEYTINDLRKHYLLSGSDTGEYMRRKYNKDSKPPGSYEMKKRKPRVPIHKNAMNSLKGIYSYIDSCSSWVLQKEQEPMDFSIKRTHSSMNDSGFDYSKSDNNMLSVCENPKLSPQPNEFWFSDASSSFGMSLENITAFDMFQNSPLLESMMELSGYQSLTGSESSPNGCEVTALSQFPSTEAPSFKSSAEHYEITRENSSFANLQEFTCETEDLYGVKCPNESKVLTCPYCDEKFYNITDPGFEFGQHLLRAHNGGFACIGCFDLFSSREDLKFHEKTCSEAIEIQNESLSLYGV